MLRFFPCRIASSEEEGEETREEGVGPPFEGSIEGRRVRGARPSPSVHSSLPLERRRRSARARCERVWVYLMADIHSIRTDEKKKKKKSRSEQTRRRSLIHPINPPPPPELPRRLPPENYGHTSPASRRVNVHAHPSSHHRPRLRGRACCDVL